MCSACDRAHESDDFVNNAKLLVVDYYNKRHSRNQITPDDVVVVCHIFGHLKMILTTNVQERMYYEVTFDTVGYQETGTFLAYIDAYKLWDETHYRIEQDDLGYFANPRRCDTL